SLLLKVLLKEPSLTREFFGLSLPMICTSEPWRTKIWFTSSRISQPSTMSRSMAKFLRMFSVSDTSSCITWGGWGLALLALGELKLLPVHVVVRRVREQLVQGDNVPRDLVHRVGEKGLEASALANWLFFVAFEQGGELGLLLVLGQHLQAVVVVAHVLLVDAQHGQQHVEQVAQLQGRPILHLAVQALEEDLGPAASRGRRISPQATHALRNTEFTSSWVMMGFLAEAAIRQGRRKQDTRTLICCTYSSSHSTSPNTMPFRFRMCSACSERMYSSTICFHRRRHSQPRKNDCTCSMTSKSSRSQQSTHLSHLEPQPPELVAHVLGLFDVVPLGLPLGLHDLQQVQVLLLQLLMLLSQPAVAEIRDSPALEAARQNLKEEPLHANSHDLGDTRMWRDHSRLAKQHDLGDTRMWRDHSRLTKQHDLGDTRMWRDHSCLTKQRDLGDTRMCLSPTSLAPGKQSCENHKMAHEAGLYSGFTGLSGDPGHQLWHFKMPIIICCCFIHLSNCQSVRRLQSEPPEQRLGFHRLRRRTICEAWGRLAGRQCVKKQPRTEQEARRELVGESLPEGSCAEQGTPEQGQGSSDSPLSDGHAKILVMRLLGCEAGRVRTGGGEKPIEVRQGDSNRHAPEGCGSSGEGLQSKFISRFQIPTVNLTAVGTCSIFILPVRCLSITVISLHWLQQFAVNQQSAVQETEINPGRSGFGNKGISSGGAAGRVQTLAPAWLVQRLLNHGLSLSRVQSGSYEALALLVGNLAGGLAKPTTVNGKQGGLVQLLILLLHTAQSHRSSSSFRRFSRMFLNLGGRGWHSCRRLAISSAPTPACSASKPAKKLKLASRISSSTVPLDFDGSSGDASRESAAPAPEASCCWRKNDGVATKLPDKDLRWLGVATWEDGDKDLRWLGVATWADGDKNLRWLGVATWADADKDLRWLGVATWADGDKDLRWLGVATWADGDKDFRWLGVATWADGDKDFRWLGVATWLCGAKGSRLRLLTGWAASTSTGSEPELPALPGTAGNAKSPNRDRSIWANMDESAAGGARRGDTAVQVAWNSSSSSRHRSSTESLPVLPLDTLVMQQLVHLANQLTGAALHPQLPGGLASIVLTEVVVSVADNLVVVLDVGIGELWSLVTSCCPLAVVCVIAAEKSSSMLASGPSAVMSDGTCGCGTGCGGAAADDIVVRAKLTRFERLPAPPPPQPSLKSSGMMSSSFSVRFRICVQRNALYRVSWSGSSNSPQLVAALLTGFLMPNSPHDPERISLRLNGSHAFISNYPQVQDTLDIIELRWPRFDRIGWLTADFLSRRNREAWISRLAQPVAMATRGEKLYALFVEEAFEASNYYSSVSGEAFRTSTAVLKLPRFTRLARICLNDPGGQQPYQDMRIMTSFFKLRLICRNGSVDYDVLGEGVDCYQSSVINIYA
uniref:Sema domain-containing protein n=1 Tax=Macrostomum lignano TaxID=282301 RepID=A0A1I8IAY9_9PLAT